MDNIVFGLWKRKKHIAVIKFHEHVWVSHCTSQHKTKIALDTNQEFTYGIHNGRAYVYLCLFACVLYVCCSSHVVFRSFVYTQTCVLVCVLFCLSVTRIFTCIGIHRIFCMQVIELFSSIKSESPTSLWSELVFLLF